MQGSFSLAVTDDSRVNGESSTNIFSNILLSSDVKALVEDPAYYFRSTGSNASALLTQSFASTGLYKV